MGRFIIACPSLPVTNHPWMGRGQGHLTNSKILHALKYLRNSSSPSRNILCGCRLSQVLAYGQLTVPERGVVRATWRLLEFHTPEISLERLKLESSNFVCLLATPDVSLVIIPERGVARVTWSTLEFYTPLNYFGMAEDRIVSFYARVAPRSINLVTTNCPKWAWSRTRDVLIF